MRPVRKLNADDVLQTHPISDRVDGWFFHCVEQSNNAYRAEGTDLWGRIVGATGGDYDSVLNDAVSSAERINRQLREC